MPPSEQLPFGIDDTALHNRNEPASRELAFLDEASAEQERQRLAASALEIIGTRQSLPDYRTVESAATSVLYEARLRYLCGAGGVASFALTEEWDDYDRQAQLRSALIELVGDHVEVSVSVVDDIRYSTGTEPTGWLVHVLIWPK
jgi:hypothetical protein